MHRTIKVATVQMDAMPAPVSQRLSRAEKIITEAAQAGAQLVVLPELFNTGYSYSDQNYELAEPLEGVTSTWMKTLSTHLNIHLAGAFLLLDSGEIYDTLLLFSPSGQMWRYDKNYPWAWERAYFREQRGMTVARTELGDLGLMICWDLGHVDIWKQYAGKADMIVISSCPPDGSGASFEFPNSETLEMNDLETMGSIKDVGRKFFGEMVDQQAKWLGLPVVNSGASGRVRTHLPRARALLTSLLLFAPRILKFLPQAQSMEMSCEMIPSCKVVDRNGSILVARSPDEGEGLVISEVTLADSKPVPTAQQPTPPLPRSTARMAFFNADVMVPFLMRSVYKNGLKKVKAVTHLISTQSSLSK